MPVMASLRLPKLVNRRIAGLARKLREEDEGIFRERKDPAVEGLARRYGYRSYILARLYAVLGSLDELEELLDANEQPMPETIRCNDYLIDCSKLAERLRLKGFKLSSIP